MTCFRSFLFLLLAMAGSVSAALATHLRAGEIIASRVSCTNLTFRITVTVYIDTESGIQFGGAGDILNFGDSTFMELPEITTQPRPDLGPNMGIASFTIDHTYSGAGKYIIRYTEAFRNAFILNIDNSVNTLFYLETIVDANPFLRCGNNTPQLLVPPIDKACTGQAWFHNPGAFDPDPGDSLSFQLIFPKRGKGTSVVNYRDPANEAFYTGIGLDYGSANEAGTGEPSLTIDPVTGTLVWDAPGAPGEYNIAFLIIEWRKTDGRWRKLGQVTRDMQIVVEDCLNQRPELEVPQELCVEAGEEITTDIFGWDPDGHPVKIEAFSEVFQVNPNPASMLPSPAVFQPSSPANKARVTFQWQTDCAHVRDQPYQVVFKITDQPGNGPALVQFKTWNIRVVGPAPQWQSAQTNLANRSAQLNWQEYACQNATHMQIWRRVDQFAFVPPECVTGMPDFLGYTLIGETPITNTQFIDTNNGSGLAVGAQYCYRLVAVFPLPGGGESYVSQEICLEPILADAPVITQVSVLQTSRTEGSMRVRWQRPFDLNAQQFPPPYEYEVYRAEGFEGTQQITKAHAGRLADTTFVDMNLNTEEQVYNYRVVLYDRNNVRVDTSFTASSVRLAAQGGATTVDLAWQAEVPWSNQTQSFPLHDIFRGAAGQPDDALVLIDQVDVNTGGLRYTDEGRFQNTPLNKNELYCYRVMTRGAYGNPRVNEPLVNFSQVVCVRVDDNEPPCQPVINVSGTNCDNYFNEVPCGQGAVYSNLLKWNRPEDEACRDDIDFYRVYAASEVDGAFTLLTDHVRDTFLLDTNLRSFARCYRVSAVDRAGNESVWSEAFCFDNCPYYELPNVFTPNGDQCNELFRAYGDPEQTAVCGNPVDNGQCARFVADVDFVVYNRWGREVYRMPGGKEKSIYIRWNGKDNEGRDLSSGVYYYKATVIFNTIDPSTRKQEMKGWVHLLRTSTP